MTQSRKKKKSTVKSPKPETEVQTHINDCWNQLENMEENSEGETVVIALMLTKNSDKH